MSDFETRVVINSLKFSFQTPTCFLFVTQSDGGACGTIDVVLKWHSTYMAPKITSDKPKVSHNVTKQNLQSCC